jgi:hypothetical protein
MKCLSCQTAAGRTASRRSRELISLRRRRAAFDTLRLKDLRNTFACTRSDPSVEICGATRNEFSLARYRRGGDSRGSTGYRPAPFRSAARRGGVCRCRIPRRAHHHGGLATRETRQCLPTRRSPKSRSITRSGRESPERREQHHSNALRQVPLSRSRCCCRHCWTTLSPSDNRCRQSRDASREQA